MFVELSTKIVLYLIHSPLFLSHPSHVRRLFLLYLLRLLYFSQNGMTSLFSGHLIFQGFIANACASGVSFLVAGRYGGFMTNVNWSIHINWSFQVLVRIRWQKTTFIK